MRDSKEEDARSLGYSFFKAAHDALKLSKAIRWSGNRYKARSARIFWQLMFPGHTQFMGVR